jgi:2-polyprenyl-6-methoxyphenol hydroxylase-like FAD-dependent oxidoreductase
VCANPLYPVGSNGTSQAIIDARVLARELALQPSIEAAIAAYDAQRRPQTASRAYAHLGSRAAPTDAQHSSEAVSPRCKRHNRRRGQPQAVATREVAPQCFSLAYPL